MKKILFCLALLAAAGETPAVEIMRGPYVDNPGAESALLRWRFDSASPGWIEYGESPDCSRYMTIASSAAEHAEYIFGLNGGKNYCYRIYVPVGNGKASYKTGEGSFYTLYPTPQTVADFLITGNTFVKDQAANEIAPAMLKSGPDFVLHTGNLTQSGLDAEADAQFFGPFAGLLKKSPFFIAPGNNEYGNNTEREAGKTFFRTNYSRSHQMPWSQGSPAYYYFDTSNLRVIVLDNTSLDGIGAAPALAQNTPQYQWLENTLQKARGDWKIAAMHYPLYSSGASGANYDMAVVLGPLFEKYGVDLVIQGHDADYERTYPIKNGQKSENGPVYVTVGAGGSEIGPKSAQNDWSAVFEPVLHFARVQINGKSLTLTAYDKDGDQIDRFVISK